MPRQSDCGELLSVGGVERLKQLRQQLTGSAAARFPVADGRIVDSEDVADLALGEACAGSKVEQQAAERGGRGFDGHMTLHFVGGVPHLQNGGNGQTWGGRYLTDMHPGPQLRAIRKSLGLTVDQAAALIGVSGSTLEHWEGQRRDPSFETLERIASAYGIEITVSVRRRPEPNALTACEPPAVIYGEDVVSRAVRSLPPLTPHEERLLSAQITAFGLSASQRDPDD